MTKKVDHTAAIASFFNMTSQEGIIAANTTANTSLFRNIVVSIDPEDENISQDFDDENIQLRIWNIEGRKEIKTLNKNTNLRWNLAFRCEST